MGSPPSRKGVCVPSCGNALEESRFGMQDRNRRVPVLQDQKAVETVPVMVKRGATMKEFP